MQIYLSRLASNTVAFPIAGALLAGCVSSNSLSTSPPMVAPPIAAPASNPIPASKKVRLYVSDGRTIKIYKLPIAGRSTPMAILKAGKGEPTGMAFDPIGRLFVANRSKVIQVFTQPILSGAVPSFTLATTGTPLDVTLNSHGDAVVVESYARGCPFCFFGYIEVFTAPISNSSTVSYTLDGGYTTVSAAFNSNGNLWTELAQYYSDKPNYMNEYAAPLREKPPIKQFGLYPHHFGPTGLAFDPAGNVYVPTQVGVEVYQPHPWRKMFTIKVSASEGYLAFGPSGNLYVTSQSSKLLEFSPPFSASSVPAVTLALHPKDQGAGIAVGP